MPDHCTQAPLSPPAVTPLHRPCATSLCQHHSPCHSPPPSPAAIDCEASTSTGYEAPSPTSVPTEPVTSSSASSCVFETTVSKKQKSGKSFRPRKPACDARSARAGSPTSTLPAGDLQRRVLAVQKSNRTANEKSAAIQSLFAAQQRLAAAAVARRTTPVSAGSFPGAGARAGCEHYARKCWIRAACCGRYYPCRRCHDAAESHTIDRHATAVVACVTCGDADQPVSSSCRTCGVRFARYFCEPCRLWDDAPEERAYHCDGCGICRVGRAEDNHHCTRCATCVPRAAADKHPCRERSLDADCPVCNVHLATSTEQTIFLRCSHPIHVACLERYIQHHFACPLCAKCIHEPARMQPWYRRLDTVLAREVLPVPLRNRVSRVLCNDCETKTLTRYHFRFHRCADCLGYNTRVLEQFDVDPADLPPPVTAVPSDLAEGGNTAQQAIDARGGTEEVNTREKLARASM